MLKGRRIPAPPTHCDHKENTSIAVYNLHKNDNMRRSVHTTKKPFHSPRVFLSSPVFLCLIRPTSIRKQSITQLQGCQIGRKPIDSKRNGQSDLIGA